MLLERTINIKKKLNSEALILIEEKFTRQFDGAMHPNLADKDHPLALKPTRKKAGRRNTTTRRNLASTVLSLLT